MSHPSRQVETFDNIRVDLKAFKRNLFFFRSIGARVKVQAEERKRRWWCLWLCKTRKSLDADEIQMSNSYFSRIEGTPIAVPAAAHDKTCRKDSKCKLRHWAVGVGVKITFPSGSTSPSTVPDLLPLDGVLSRAVVRVEGRSLEMAAGKGPHP